MSTEVTGAGPSGSIGTNWAGSYSYRAARLVRPRTVDELCEVVAGSTAVRALGSRHSFSDLPDTTGTLVDLAALPMDLRVDHAGPGGTAAASVGAGARYGELAVALEQRGWALAAMASLPHISVAGAVATGTHGSGDRTGSLAAAVRAVEVVGAGGIRRRVERGEPDFDGSVVALGALGVVTRLELDVEPSYDVAQEVRTGLTWPVLERRFDVTAAAYSVSMFTDFDGGVDQLWLKHRVGDERTADRFGTAQSTRPLHMLRGGAGAGRDRTGGGGRAVARPAAALPPRLHAEQRRRAAERVLRTPRARPRRNRPAPAPRTRVPPAAPGGRDPHHRSRCAVAQRCPRVRHRRPALHVGARRTRGAAGSGGRRGAAGAARRSAALGQGVRDGRIGPRRGVPRLADFARLRDHADPDRVFGNAFVDRVLGEG